MARTLQGVCLFLVISCLLTASVRADSLHSSFYVENDLLSLVEMKEKFDAINRLPAWQRDWHAIVPIFIEEPSTSEGAGSWLVLNRQSYDVGNWEAAFWSSDTGRIGIYDDTIAFLASGDKAPGYYALRFERESINRRGASVWIGLPGRSGLNVSVRADVWNTEGYERQDFGGTGVINENGRRTVARLTTLSSKTNAFRVADFSGQGCSLGLRVIAQISPRMKATFEVNNLISAENLKNIYSEELEIDSRNFTIDENNRITYTSSGKGTWAYEDISTSLPTEFRLDLLADRGNNTIGIHLQAVELKVSDVLVSLLGTFRDLEWVASWSIIAETLSLSLEGERVFFSLSTDHWDRAKAQKFGLILGFRL